MAGRPLEGLIPPHRTAGNGPGARRTAGVIEWYGTKDLVMHSTAKSCMDEYMSELDVIGHFLGK